VRTVLLLLTESVTSTWDRDTAVSEATHNVSRRRTFGVGIHRPSCVCTSELDLLECQSLEHHFMTSGGSDLVEEE
jgi:hypothetical protein